jgi:hypothetical protein
MARVLAEAGASRDAPLRAAAFRRLAALPLRLPRAWTGSPRRRRLLLLSLAAPGFLMVFTTPLHHSLGALALGLVLFAGALVFRRGSEPGFVRAEAALLGPPPAFVSKES